MPEPIRIGRKVQRRIGEIIEWGVAPPEHVGGAVPEPSGGFGGERKYRLHCHYGSVAAPRAGGTPAGLT